MMRLMKLNLQIIKKKKMIKLNKLRYYDVSFRYSRASWGVLGCLGVSWGNKTDRFLNITLLIGWFYPGKIPNNGTAVRHQL